MAHRQIVKFSIGSFYILTSILLLGLFATNKPAVAEVAESIQTDEQKIACSLKNDESISAFAIDYDSNFDFDTIQVSNLINLQAGLQEAFNYQSLVNIDYQNNQINSLVLATNQRQIDNSVITRGGPNPTCNFGKPPC